MGLDEAFDNFQKAVYLNPSDVKAHLYLGTAWMSLYIPGSSVSRSANFANPAALNRVGNNYYALTSESGPPLIGAGLAGGNGAVSRMIARQSPSTERRLGSARTTLVSSVSSGSPISTSARLRTRSHI